MSATDFAVYLEQRIVELGLCKSEVARRAGISRQTWYRLAAADVQDLKLTTIIRLASALQTSPLHLLGLYFQAESSATLAT